MGVAIASQKKQNNLTNNVENKNKKKNSDSKFEQMKKDKLMYLLLLPSLLFVFIFNYIPIPGILITFKQFDIGIYNNVLEGMIKSPWVGFDNIARIFENNESIKAIFNTMFLSSLTLLIFPPIPIFIALLINEVKNTIFKRSVQTISYLPHFLSSITVIGIVMAVYGTYGPINDILVALFGTGARINLMQQQWFFIPNQLMVTIWVGTGWGTILYLATISGIDVQLYEAAKIDGANRFKQVIHITLPQIIPTFIILLILSVGSILSAGFDNILGFQNAFINFETIDTLVYKTGLLNGDYSLAAAIGFSRGLIALILTFVVNFIAKKVSDISLF